MHPLRHEIFETYARGKECFVASPIPLAPELDVGTIEQIRLLVLVLVLMSW